MFVVTQENFSLAQDFIANELEKLKLKDKEIFLAQLLFEENFLRMKKGIDNENFSVQIEIRRWLGDVSLILRSKGEKFNPIENLTAILNRDDENYYNLAILKANRNKISYTRKDGANVVSILVHEMTGKQTYLTLACIFFGICFGLLFKEFCSAEIIEFLEENILKSIREMFMNALMMMIPPLIFFSVMSGITDMSNSTDIGRIGGKFVLISIAKLSLVVIIGAFLSEIIFSNGIPEIFSAIHSSAQISESNFSMRDKIVGIIPSNLIDPFRTGNISEILFLAIFFGTIINRSGERAHEIKNSITFMNKFCLDVMNIIMKFIPVVALTSTMNVILDVGLNMLISLGQLIFGTILGAAVILLLDGVLISFFCRLSPIIFWQKNLRFSILPFTLVSSNGCIPKTLQFCTQKFGIDSKLAMFSIPVGIHLNRGNTAFYCSFISVLMANTFGVEINFHLLAMTIIMSIFISCTMPGIIIGLSPIFLAIGIPLEAITIFVCIFAILDMFDTAGNVMADISSTLLLAKSENKLDLKVYNS